MNSDSTSGGLFATTGETDVSLMRRLAASLSHRGSVTVDGSVAAAHVVRDGHERGGHQRGDNVVVAWSGVIRDGDVSVAAYRRDGIAFAERLDGEFVLLVRDGDTLHVVRDAAGGRTVYFGQLHASAVPQREPARWVVSCEPKGIWSLDEFPTQLRDAAVAEYLTFSFLPSQRTMLEGLSELPAGCRVELQSGRPAKVIRYFDPLLTPADDDDPARWPKRFRQLLEEEVACRLRRDVAPAVFLSGGLDSSIVTAEVARQSSRPVRTFAIHFGRRYPNELSFARLVAERFGTDHHEILIRPRAAVKRLRQMVWHLDEPVGDPVTAPNFELAARVAALGVTEVFNGEGGDPLFGGPKNLPMMLGHWYGGDETSRAQRYLASYRRGFEELQHVLTEPFQQRLASSLDLEAIVDPFFDRDGPLLHKLLAINTQLKGAHLILPKVERLLSASGVTPLSPMFTRRMIELAFASPPQAKLNGGCEKWLLKQAYRDVVPDAILARPKSGMRVPVHYWFRGPLKRFARRTLNRRSLEQAGLFDADRVQQWLHYDIGQANGRYGLRIWMLLTFELWRQMVLTKTTTWDDDS